MNNDLILGALLVVNVALYAALVFAALRYRRLRVEASNLSEAFAGLELALRRALPDLPSGFTWEEAMEHLQSSGVETEGMEAALRGYEEYRYGGRPLPTLDYRGVLQVANALGRAAPAKRGGASVGR